MMKFKLTPEQARMAWAEALESGEYTQGYGRLRRGNEHCCLGVACEVFRREEGEELLTGIVLESQYQLPIIVKDWLGLVGVRGEYTFYKEEASLDRDNDVYRLSFTEIAHKVRNGDEYGLWRTENCSV